MHPLAALSLASAALFAPTGAGSRSGSPGSGVAPGIRVTMPSRAEDEAQDALGRLQAALDAGERDGARELLSGIVEGLPDPAPGEEASQVAFLLELDPFVMELGMPDVSLTMWERILTLRKRILPADHDEVVQAKGNLAVARFDLGDLDGAGELFEEMLETWSRLRPADDLGLLTLQQNLAAIRLVRGDLVGARALFEAVLAARTRLLPPDDLDLLKAKQNLGATLLQLGDIEGSHALNEAVYAARARLLPADHPELLAARVNLAATRKALGDLAGARELEEAVLEARARLLPPGHPDRLRAMQNLAATRAALGDLAGARELEEAALEARLRLLPADHPALLDGMGNLAATRYETGDLAGARELVSSMLARMRLRMRALRGEAGRPARENARAELQRFPDALFLASVVDPERTLEAALFATLESLRLASLADAEVARAAAERPDLGRRIATLRSQLNNLVVAGPADAADLEAWRGAVLALAEERDRAQRALQQTLVERGGFVEEVDASSVAARLAPGTAAASFLRYRRTFEQDPATGIVPPAVDWLLAFLVLPDGTVRRIELGAAEEVEALVADWRKALGRPLQGRGVSVSGDESEEALLRVTGRRLRERVLDPLLDDLGEVRALYLELDDVLHLVPLDALPLEEGLVGDRLVLHAEATLARLLRPESGITGGRLTLAGGIDYDADPGAIARAADTPRFEAAIERFGADGSTFDLLAGTAAEIAAIAELYVGDPDDHAVLLEGSAASKATLAALAPETRFLHLATHGWFASERFASWLDRESEPASAGDLRRAQEVLTGFAPETLCGVALAGANRGPDAEGRAPGILTAEELASFDLHRCELAVLSACETNVGIRRAGQGIQSLQSALHAAGARSAITSLWRVDDAATRRLMVLFYTKLWREGLGKADALWQAKMALRAEGDPVRDWAGWVLTGAPD